MPRQITQWVCEICGNSDPSWVEEDAQKCEASHQQPITFWSLYFEHPGDKYPKDVHLSFDPAHSGMDTPAFVASPKWPSTVNIVPYTRKDDDRGGMQFSFEDVNRVRQWGDALKDLSPNYWQPEDQILLDAVTSRCDNLR